MTRIINRRYALGESLGKGGMGEVYRAHDRLTGNTVALKRVHTALNIPDSSIKPEDLRLALAQEFASLASLRHPNIIGVSDYGFDEERIPYFTMEYLENAKTICEAGFGQPIPVQIDLLAQILRALAYIHRRGILHRDLKPSNVLVIERGGAAVVKVLDFGLASELNHVPGWSGTIAYIAPELISGGSLTYAADLYSLGIIAYEMLTGEYPFAGKPVHSLMQHVLKTPIDLNAVPLPLRMMVGWMLAKSPEDRYASAEAVIEELSIISGSSIPLDTAITRESYLQASRFVGRETELNTLTDGLRSARAGKGGAWLIGGESGVGKTRLVDELSTRALVDGALVLRGYLSEQGGLPYELWHDPLRRLVLGTLLTPLEIAVLKNVVPDIESLVEAKHEGEPFAELTGDAARHRLHNVILDMFRRQQPGILLILEDLHWASESFEPLKLLLEAQYPILIVGTFRDDEAPDLPEHLPSVPVMALERLTTQETAALTESMLGAQKPEIVDLLQRETEGNVFFLVETVRALAEEAGDLHSVGRVTLPRAVLAGGVQAIIRRRLSHVPVWGQPLLKLAAVAGRQLDFSMLTWLASAQNVEDVEAWVIATANAAVGEVQDETWRFAHDKLRQAALAELEPAERQQLHHLVAVAIETLYVDHTSHAQELLYHWREAGDISREVKYLMMAAERAIHVTATYESALMWLHRALNQIEADPDDPRRGKIFNLLGRAYFLLGEQHEARTYFQWALTFGTPDIEAAARLGLAESRNRGGDLTGAMDYVEQALAYYRSSGDQNGVADALQIIASIHMDTGNYANAVIYLTEALELRRTLGNQQGIGMCHNMLGNLNLYMGDYDSARRHYDESLRIRTLLGDIRGMSATLNNLSLIAQDQSEYDKAWSYQEQSLELKRRINDRHGIEVSLSNLGYLAQLKGDLNLTERLYLNALELQREIGDKRGMGTTFADLAVVAMNKDEDEVAQLYFDESHRIKEELDDRQGATVYYLNYAAFHMVRGQNATARTLINEALTVARSLGEPYLEGNCLLQCGDLEEQEWRWQNALVHLNDALRIFRDLATPRDTAQTLMVLARTHASASAFDDALAALREASAIVANLNVPNDKLRLLLVGAHVEWRRGNDEESAALIGLIEAHVLAERADRYMLARLRAHFDPMRCATAYQTGKTRDLDAEIARLQTLS